MYENYLVIKIICYMVLVNYQSNMDIASGKTEDKVILMIQNYIKATFKVNLSSFLQRTIKTMFGILCRNLLL